MNAYLKKIALAAFAALGFAASTQAAAQATADVAVVGQISGPVTFEIAGSQTPARAFMKVREGDRFTVGAGGEVKVVYFATGRVEVWKGPATFTASRGDSKEASGNVTVSQVAANDGKMLALSKLANLRRTGDVVVRSAGPAGNRRIDPAQARTEYEAWVRKTTPDDILPELYLYAVLEENGDKAGMQEVANTMLKKQPNSDEAKELAARAQAR
jgi:hypothetical protein